jgi:two-component system, OmpR family, response regulator
MQNKIKLFLVDDDPLFLKVLALQFAENDNYIIETFSTGELCIQNLSKIPDVIILDYYLNGINKNAMNGIDTLKYIKNYNLDISVIMLSSQDKIEVAINCMHYGALDYVVKSETSFIQLQQSITNIISLKKVQRELNWYMQRM